MNIIEYQHVSMKYGSTLIIPDLSLEIKRGECLTIIGTSGCGKTTILKMVNGLIIPTSGNVLVEGKDTKHTDLTKLRRSIGYAIQGSEIFPHMTVEKNISYVPDLSKMWSKEEKKVTIKKWMDLVGLDESLRKRYPRELSGGQQQRVGIARALAASPHIMLMDEPFSAVDGITRRQLQSEFIQIQQKTGVTVLFVTHDISEALKLGSRVLVMTKGQIEQLDTPENIVTHPASQFVAKLLDRSE